MLNTEKYYRILDLEPEASPEEIHQGYLDLTWVWHPDRFVGHPRLQKKAHYKLQEINEAHTQLRSLQPRTWKRRNPPTKSRPQPKPSSARQFQKSPLQSQPAKPTERKDFREKRRHQPVEPVRYKCSKLDDWLD
ncbi:MAG: J domain-containing protein [Symploca sp. SIO2E6]|nr:J domain-containing protein [Symploca sp. SIO2E6]